MKEYFNFHSIKYQIVPILNLDQNLKLLPSLQSSLIHTLNLKIKFRNKKLSLSILYLMMSFFESL